MRLDLFCTAIVAVANTAPFKALPLGSRHLESPSSDEGELRWVTSNFLKTSSSIQRREPGHIPKASSSTQLNPRMDHLIGDFGVPGVPDPPVLMPSRAVQIPPKKTDELPVTQLLDSRTGRPHASSPRSPTLSHAHSRTNANYLSFKSSALQSGPYLRAKSSVVDSQSSEPGSLDLSKSRSQRISPASPETESSPLRNTSASNKVTNRLKNLFRDAWGKLQKWYYASVACFKPSQKIRKKPVAHQDHSQSNSLQTSSASHDISEIEETKPNFVNTEPASHDGLTNTKVSGHHQDHIQSLKPERPAEALSHHMAAKWLPQPVQRLATHASSYISYYWPANHVSHFYNSWFSPAGPRLTSSSKVPGVTNHPAPPTDDTPLRKEPLGVSNDKGQAVVRDDEEQQQQIASHGGDVSPSSASTSGIQGQGARRVRSFTPASAEGQLIASLLEPLDFEVLSGVIHASLKGGNLSARIFAALVKETTIENIFHELIHAYAPEAENRLRLYQIPPNLLQSIENSLRILRSNLD